MLFMGEEWGSNEPFPFFCDFQGDLAEAVRNGRRKEFADAYAKYGDEIPIRWRSDMQPRCSIGRPRDRTGRERLRLVRELLAIRRREIVPRLVGARFGRAQAADGRLLSAHWRMGDGRRCSSDANLSDREPPPGRVASAEP